MSVSRRGFIKRAGVAAGAAAMYAMTGKTAEAKVNAPQKWDMTYDVVVIGYGGAGAATAITAHDAGAKVVILEKMNEGGGNTAVSLGGVYQPNDIKKAITYVKALFKQSLSDMDEKLVELYLNEASTVVSWLESLKPDTKMKIYGHAGFPQVEGSENVDKWNITGGGKTSGSNLWAVYAYAVEEARKIPVMLNTPAKRLVTNNDGEVIGLIATQNGKDISIKASKGVVLTTGGFEYNETMLKNYVKGIPVMSLGNPGNTGDGIRMAQEVGADLWHMTGTSCPLGIKLPGYQAATMWSFRAPGCIWVDRTGKRFINEKSVEGHAGLLAVDYFDGHALMYSRIPCYAIFDDTARAEGGPVTGTTSGYVLNREKGGYRWTRDNLAEIEKGWIIKADTIKELAEKIKVDPAILEKTVAKWNIDIKNGEDTEFHRDITDKSDPSKAAHLDRHQKELSAPIENGPYYAVELFPSLLNTQGGPRRNINAQVLNPFGEPINRLYSAGELGSMWGTLYQGGGNNTESIVFGRVAGANVVKEKPWG